LRRGDRECVWDWPDQRHEDAGEADGGAEQRTERGSHDDRTPARNLPRTCRMTKCEAATAREMSACSSSPTGGQTSIATWSGRRWPLGPTHYGGREPDRERPISR